MLEYEIDGQKWQLRDPRAFLASSEKSLSVFTFARFDPNPDDEKFKYHPNPNGKAIWYTLDSFSVSMNESSFEDELEKLRQKYGVGSVMVERDPTTTNQAANNQNFLMIPDPFKPELQDKSFTPLSASIVRNAALLESKLDDQLYPDCFKLSERLKQHGVSPNPEISDYLMAYLSGAFYLTRKRPGPQRIAKPTSRWNSF